MKRIVLFSTLTDTNKYRILSEIFSNRLELMMFAYMPSDGNNIHKKYVNEWKAYAEEYGAQFTLINNASSDNSEKEKLRKSNILVITGGNTFQLLHNLRKSGFDKEIKDFVLKDNYVLAGFSAGALVLTPTIEICNLPNYDENLVGLNDLTGLGIVEFEVFPHASKDFQKSLDKYRKIAKYEVKHITDNDYISLELLNKPN